MPSKGETRRQQVRRQRERRRQWFKEAKGTFVCGSCGMSDWRCLDFHHRDPATKAFNIGSISTRYSKEAIIAEIEKCDILCANCHRIHHYEERDRV